ncbi:uncharacterized protein LOC111072577 [Drosophila obscura]|uniref:uncharacterized protein LOC111072577 n=1 Tax=Drosophila obscura TaxID=7282 RepID=UPI001BB1289D|nr:uncharacterized protein LOC111072577 [Drosophila obscura]
MANNLEEFIILTPLTCVEQCNALMEATTAKPKPCYLFISLFGVYCGLVAYRSYRSYLANIARSQEPVPRPVDVVSALPAAFVSELGELPPRLMFESLSFTDNSWCYYGELTTPSMDRGRTTEIKDNEQDANKPSTSKSVIKLGAIAHKTGDEK